jgi:hypothetical protein
MANQDPWKIKVYDRSQSVIDVTAFTVLPPLPKAPDPVPETDEEQTLRPPIKMTEREEALWRNLDVHDRSAQLFLLGVLLRKKGMRDDLIVSALAKHPLSMDKYFGRTQREAERIVGNMDKKGISGDDEVVIEHIVSWNWINFMSRPTRVEWLVRDSWIASSVGFISGRAKSYKTWTAEDLALSVMTGTKFLDTFRTMKPGPVLMVQEEDPASVIQERLGLIAAHKGIPAGEVRVRGGQHRMWMPNLPFSIFNLAGFKLEDDGKVGQVIAEIRKQRPALVILDPFINLISSEQTDEYRGSAIANALQTFKQWREEFGCAVLVVHHWNKSTDTGRGGENLYASFAFHAWLESALHIRPIVEEGEQIREVTVEREFKADKTGSRFKIEWDIQTDRPGPAVYQPIVGTHVQTPQDDLMGAIESNPDSDLKGLSQVTGIATRQLQQKINDLIQRKKVRAIKEGPIITYHLM